LRNPFNGITRGYSVIFAPSPDLQPEEADTLTLGAVFTPRFFPGLSLSVDYYDIEIGGAIASFPAQQVIDNCFAEFQAGKPGPFCASTSLSGTGAGTEINSITVQLLNLASLRTRGVDFELAYRFNLGSGRVMSRVYGTYVADLISDDGLGVAPTFNAAGIIQTRGSVIDRAGQVGGFTAGLNTGATSVPHWQVNGSIGYETDRWATTFTGRWIDGGIVDATLVQPGDPDYNLNWSGSVNIFEKGERQVQFYAVVNNVLNAEPPFPYSALAGFYDRIGRSYKVGVRFTF
jgi:outer membrane receptor protein involved in Fe transport